MHIYYLAQHRAGHIASAVIVVVAVVLGLKITGKGMLRLRCVNHF